MTLNQDAPYDDRLAAVRALLAELDEIPGLPPVDLADQLLAATRDANGIIKRLQPALAILEPHHPRRLVEVAAGVDAQREIMARTLAAAAWFRYCPHMSTPQPAVARMALRRIDCRRCVNTIVKPSPDEADRCDWCGRRGVTTFWDLAYQAGPWLVLGDACDGCHHALVGET